MKLKVRGHLTLATVSIMMILVACHSSRRVVYRQPETKVVVVKEQPKVVVVQQQPTQVVYRPTPATTTTPTPTPTPTPARPVVYKQTTAVDSTAFYKAQLEKERKD